MSPLRGLAWVTLVLASLIVMLGVSAVASSKSTTSTTVRVLSSAPTGCGAFGNLTCHLIGTADAHIYDVGDDSWVLIQVGHCYSVNVDGATVSHAREVACPVAPTTQLRFTLACVAAGYLYAGVKGACWALIALAVFEIVTAAIWPTKGN